MATISNNETKRGAIGAPLLLTLLMVMLGPPTVAYCVEKDGEGWRLIWQERNTELYYRVEDSAPGVTVAVKVKFVSGAENSPMYFLDEVDCTSWQVRRLKVSVHNPTCTGEGEPVYEESFKAVWDRPSDGIESAVIKAVCE